MKTFLGLAAVIGIAVSTAGCDRSPLDQTATVTDRFMTNLDPCRWETSGEHGDEDEWPLELGSKFKLEVRQKPRYYLDVKGQQDNPLEKADMYVFNPKAPALGSDYCAQGGAVRNHVYTFGMTEVEHTHDPHDDDKLRAIIYFPLRLNPATPANRGDAFYLMLMRVRDDPSDCESGPEPTKIRCEALQRLGVLYRQHPEQFAAGVQAEIQNILPDDPSRVIVFHNGVIHGNF
jgi:hypothetical protein